MECFRIKCEYSGQVEKLYSTQVNDAKLSLNEAINLELEAIKVNYDINTESKLETIKQAIKDDLTPIVCEGCQSHEPLIYIGYTHKDSSYDASLCEDCLKENAWEYMQDNKDCQNAWNEHVSNNYGPFDRPNDECHTEFELDYIYKYYLNEVV